MLEVSQEEAIEILNSGVNVFLTGKAGAGKSYTIESWVKKSNKNIALTATTGIAALNIGGETIHRFLGLRISNRPEEADQILNYWDRVKNSRKPWDVQKWKVLQKLDVIVIDEVSMLRRDQFELIDIVLSGIKNNTAPFGGVQVVLVGDFLQLPPVVTPYDLNKFDDLATPFCFQSRLWGQAKFYSIMLNTNYRQSEKEFMDALDNIRVGQIGEKENQLISSRVGLPYKNGSEPIKIYSHKKDVNKENINKLKELGNQIYLEEASYTGNKFYLDLLKKECIAENKLYYCVNAQVMMITNDINGYWVNGSLGKIIKSEPITIKLYNGKIVKPDKEIWEKYNYKVFNGRLVKESVATMKQYPFKLGFCQTSHKSQGLTLDCADVDLSKCFAEGQAYVAISRVKSLDGLYISGWDPSKVLVNQDVLRFYGASS